MLCSIPERVRVFGFVSLGDHEGLRIAPGAKPHAFPYCPESEEGEVDDPNDFSAPGIVVPLLPRTS
eukprot:6897587-Pyramimonas_sp.AAC.1